MLLQNNEATLATLHQLRALGVRIAMDDFGTGYSSLSYLRSFPFDKIKIDRCFVADLSEASEDALAILRAVAGLGISLGIATTAEGVETKEQLAARARGRLHGDAGLLLQPAAADQRRSSGCSWRGPRRRRSPADGARRQSALSAQHHHRRRAALGHVPGLDWRTSVCMGQHRSVQSRVSDPQNVDQRPGRADEARAGAHASSSRRRSRYSASLISPRA